MLSGIKRAVGSAREESLMTIQVVDAVIGVYLEVVVVNRKANSTVRSFALSSARELF